jgi:hypothetical protein
LQVDGIEALQVPNFLAVDFAETVFEVPATEEVLEIVELLDMAAV